MAARLLGVGVSMPMPPIGVAPGVMAARPMPMPMAGVAAGPADGVCPSGVSSHRERPFLGVGVTPMAGVSPPAQPLGVAPISPCTASR